MASLETQYENHLLNNPESKLTFEEWMILLGKNLEQVFKDIEDGE